MQLFGNKRLQADVPLSDKTVRDITVILKSCLKYGMQKGYISSERINIVFPSNRNKCTKIETYNVKEQQIIVEAVLFNLSSQSNGILLSLYT